MPEKSPDKQRTAIDRILFPSVRGWLHLLRAALSATKSTDVHTERYQMRNVQHAQVQASGQTQQQQLAAACRMHFAGARSAPTRRFAMQRLNGARPITVINCHCDIHIARSLLTFDRACSSPFRRAFARDRFAVILCASAPRLFRKLRSDTFPEPIAEQHFTL